MLFDPDQFTHIRRGFLMTQIHTVPLLFQHPAHIVAVFITAAVRLESTHTTLMLEDLTHHPRFRHEFISVVEDYVMDIGHTIVDVGDWHTEAIPTTPGHVHNETHVVRGPIRQNTVIVLQTVRRKRQTFLFNTTLHKKTAVIYRIQIPLNVLDLLLGVSVRMLILKIRLTVFVLHRDRNELIARIPLVICFHSGNRVVGGPNCTELDLLDVIADHSSGQRGLVIVVQLHQPLRTASHLLILHQIVSNQEFIRTSTTSNRAAQRHQPQRREIPLPTISNGFVLCGHIRRSVPQENFVVTILVGICQNCTDTIQHHFNHTVRVGNIHIRAFRELSRNIPLQELNQR